MTTSPLYEDKELFGRIAAGDEAAFSDLYYSYLPRLEPFVHEITKSETATAELIQDTFLRIWLNRDKLPGIDNPRAWIYKVASHLCFNHLERKTVEHRVLADLAYTAVTSAAAAASPNAGHATPDHLPELTLRELQGIVNEAIQKLPVQRRRIYELSRRQGLSIDQIALELDISPNTVKNTLVSALAFIRRQLEGSGYIIPALIFSWLL